MGDLIPDSNSSDLLKDLINETNSQIVNNVLNTLGGREANILRMRFGIGFDQPMTLEEIGNHYGLSKERIRQIETKALRKMRNPLRTTVLKEAI